ncbi:Ca-activated chloride channel family protein [Persephonella hydrogeniphila]|uniref:Ca-activated chloride channel family protein n=1 Tax=Persephonella hydrogeniphila TaxID=198703 RepID=A0A285N5G0_9AQUI|nr:Ca-activated chloride channel family protein [Persephonella hydrogeniphila]
MVEFKYLIFLVPGVITIICVIVCSIIYRSSKITYFPHIELFGKPVRYISRYIPYLVVILVILLTAIAVHPYRTEKLFTQKKVYNIVVCLDVSNSMKEKRKLEIAKNVLRDFVLERDIEDRIGIVVFDNLPFRVVPLTTDRGKILRLIPKIHPAMVDIGGTSMYDALIDALDMFNPALKNKIVILLSDGGDINSKNTIEDVILKNRTVKAKIYTIGISSGIHSFALERLAYSSGAKPFFVTGDYREALQGIFREINRLEPSFVQEYSYEVEKPVDFYLKILAFLVGSVILVKILTKREI